MGQRKHGCSGLQGQAGVAEQFKAACAAQGTTSNAVLQQAVKAFLDEHPAPEQPHAAGNIPNDDTETRRAALLESIKGL